MAEARSHPAGRGGKVTRILRPVLGAAIGLALGVLATGLAGESPLAERVARMQFDEQPLEPWEDVHDPAGGDIDVFLECAREIADLLHEVIPRLH